MSKTIRIKSTADKDDKRTQFPTLFFSQLSLSAKRFVLTNDTRLNKRRKEFANDTNDP